MTRPSFYLADPCERLVRIPHRRDELAGSVSLVERARAVVLVASDRCGSRHDPAERTLLAGLRQNGFATLLVDLLLPPEAASPELAAWTRSRTDELAMRIASARAFAGRRPGLSRLPMVLFGQGAGAAAALLSAAARPAGVDSVVVRGPFVGSLAIDEVQVPIFLACEKSPAVCARITSAWIHSRLATQPVEAAREAVAVLAH